MIYVPTIDYGRIERALPGSINVQSITNESDAHPVRLFLRLAHFIDSFFNLFRRRVHLCL